MSLIENVLQFIIDIYVKILGTIGDFVVMPLITSVINKVPNVAEYLTYFTSFVARIFNGVAFAKEVFLMLLVIQELYFCSCSFLFL